MEFPCEHTIGWGAAEIRGPSLRLLVAVIKINPSPYIPRFRVLFETTLSIRGFDELLKPPEIRNKKLEKPPIIDANISLISNTPAKPQVEMYLCKISQKIASPIHLRGSQANNLYDFASLNEASNKVKPATNAKEGKESISQAGNISWKRDKVLRSKPYRGRLPLTRR